jgi:hypothetical protein
MTPPSSVHEVEEQVVALRLRFDDQFACHRR